MNITTDTLFYTGVPVLVTGAAGFIGSHITRALVAQGAHVTALDDLSTGSLENINDVLPSIEFIQGSVTDLQTCLQATKKQHIIYHLAALKNVPESYEHPHRYHEINTQGTAYLLEAARINGVERFIFSSSAAVYGEHLEACSEQSVCKPQSPYGYSKLIAEYYCREYATLFGLSTLILRYFNVYGSSNESLYRQSSVITQFKKKLCENVPITIFGDGNQERDFTPVEHVVSANLSLALFAHDFKGEVVNIATGTSITVLDLVSKLKNDFPSYNQEILFEKPRLGDIKISKADCSKYQTILKAYASIK